MDQDIGHGKATAERRMMSTPPDSAGDGDPVGGALNGDSTGVMT